MAIKEYGIRIEELPAKFQAEVRRLQHNGVAPNDIWRTNAFSPEEAIKNVREIIKICTQEPFNEPSEIILINKSKTFNVMKWNTKSSCSESYSV